MKIVKEFQLLEYLDAKGTSVYRQWLDAIKDISSRAIIQRRITRLEKGLLGDCKSVGDGVFELRIDHGPGYRVYFGFDKGTIIILLLGGTKKRQSDDILQAKKLWTVYGSLK